MNRNRLILLAGASAAALIVVVVLVVAVGSGGSSREETTTAGLSTGTGPTTPASLFAGIPQNADRLGKPSAPATLLVFEDPQCPFCREFSVDVLPAVVDQFVRTGRLTLAFRGINIIGPNSKPGLEAIYAAAAQHKLWSMAEQLYRQQGEENSGWITPRVIRDAATAIGADPAAIVRAMPSSASRMAGAEHEATALGVQGTPSFYLLRPPGQPQQLNITSLDATTFTSALAAALQ